MTTKLISLFALCVLLGTVMLACGGGADNANTAANTNTAAGNANTKGAATPAAASTPAAATSAAGDIGVAECDEFLRKYEACVGKVPAAAQATFKSSMEQWRNSWKQLAANPQTKSTLAAACKSSLESAKTSLASYNCSW
ncbi:MAG TPA: hypothetical protein VF586_21510 [Pyrinomonadaceae bacterium]|jgi:hypothetical protein